MEDFTKHRADFNDGFKDGYLSAEAKKPCRWKKHIDQNDGKFVSPNPVYSLFYEMGYIYQQEGKELTDDIVESMFISLVKVIFEEHHNEFNL